MISVFLTLIKVLRILRYWNVQNVFFWPYNLHKSSRWWWMVTIEDLFKNVCFSASHFLKCPSSLKHSCPPPHKKPPTHSLLKMKGAEYRYFNQYVNHSYNLLWFHQYSSITNSGEFSCWPDPQNLIYVHWNAILNAQYCLDHLATNFMSPRNWDFP